VKKKTEAKNDKPKRRRAPCDKGRIAPTTETKLRLFADSGGFCQNPECLSELFRDIEDTTVHVAEMAHIISAADDGPRANTTVTAEQRGCYTNLILLCPMCHTIIDKAEDKHPEALVMNWKQTHKQKITNLFGVAAFDTREKARNFITPLLVENRTIFEQYGPMSEERFNPESSMPIQWLRKIRVKIIPNNRRLLTACDANRIMLTPDERKTVELLRQHVDDFEAKHLGETDQNGSRFPPDMERLFADLL
jgi:hypothetical protein